MHRNIANLFDCWSNPVVHLLLLQSSLIGYIKNVCLCFEWIRNVKIKCQFCNHDFQLATCWHRRPWPLTFRSASSGQIFSSEVVTKSRFWKLSKPTSFRSSRAKTARRWRPWRGRCNPFTKRYVERNRTKINEHQSKRQTIKLTTRPLPLTVLFVLWSLSSYSYCCVSYYFKDNFCFRTLLSMLNAC